MTYEHHSSIVQVFGGAFGVLGTTLSIAVFHNPVSIVGMAGYGVTCFGVLLYIREKHGAGAKTGVISPSNSRTKMADEEAAATG